MTSKTEKTIAEMEIDMNQNFDWSRIQESDKQLTPAFGPGFTGLINIGNRFIRFSFTSQLLYGFSSTDHLLSSRVPKQVSFSVLLMTRYAASADQAFKQAPSDPAGDFYTQM